MIGHALVTGGAGFIGSHLVDRLLGEGWQVTSVDNFDAFYPREVKEHNLEGHREHPGFRLVEADIRDARGLARRLGGRYDVLVHLAARAGVRPSIEDPLAYTETNVAGTQNLLDLARGLEIEQFVFASSSSVYGVNPRVPWREDDPVLLPISPYAATKVAGELLGHVYSHLYGMRFLALRFFTVYGPRQRPDLAIHKFATSLLAGQPIPVYGDGSTRRDYTYIDDIIDGVRAAIDYRGSRYEVINLGESRPVGLLELVARLEQELGIPARIERLTEQPGDVPQTFASTDKARRLLGWIPRTTLDEGIARFVAWLHQRREVPEPAAVLGR